MMQCDQELGLEAVPENMLPALWLEYGEERCVSSIVATRCSALGELGIAVFCQ